VHRRQGNALMLPLSAVATIAAGRRCRRHAICLAALLPLLRLLLPALLLPVTVADDCRAFMPQRACLRPIVLPTVWYLLHVGCALLCCCLNSFKYTRLLLSA